GARFAGPRDGIKAPDRIAVLQLKGANPTLDGHLAAGGTDDDEGLEDDRRHREGFALVRVTRRAFPEQAARVRVKRPEGTGARPADDRALLQRNATALWPVRPGFVFPMMAPAKRARRGVKGNRVRRRREVHNAAIDERTRVERVQVADLVTATRLERVCILAV